MTTWLDPGQCSSCKYCNMDMDMDPFCAEPTVLVKYRYGLNINTAIQDYCGPELKLRVPKEESDDLCEVREDPAPPEPDALRQV